LNIQEYISSGIIQSYVLGLAGPEDQAEFERMCAEHPEIMAARHAFELQLENQALSQAIDPPADLKNKILTAIANEPVKPAKKSIQNPSFPLSPQTMPRIGWTRYVAAASVFLLLGSTALNFYFFTRYRDTIAKYDQLVSTQTQTALSNQVLQTRLQDYESAINLIKDPQIAEVKMPGLPKGPDPSSLTTVYWDTRSKDVYLLVNNLPRPTTDKQYQLWAMVDGKPVDAGVFDLKQGLSFVKMKNIPRAEAFAITLEKRGGSQTPTMEALYVLGKVTG
jgi:anti-sigma-K factor RskA